jgi:hypothetical protein
LLRAATVFTLPVPEPVIGTPAAVVGGSSGRLCGLGLLDPYPDLHDPARPALSASQLIALLDARDHRVPVALPRQAASAVFTSGDGPQGEALLDRATAQAEAGDAESGPLGRANVMFEQASRLITRGEPGQAQELLQRAWQLFTQAGAERDAAVVMGTVADIAYQCGDYDEALRIAREVQLPAFERLGDTRRAAVTWGRIPGRTAAGRRPGRPGAPGT